METIPQERSKSTLLRCGRPWPRDKKNAIFRILYMHVHYYFFTSEEYCPNV